MILENIPLKPLSTFKVGGVARYFIEIREKSDLFEAADFLASKSLPFAVLGGGSNVLISDENFEGLVIKISTNGLEWKDLGEEIEVKSQAGTNWDFLVSESVKKNLYGLENLSGIPGTVGGAPIQNIGAYGGEVKNTLYSVEFFDLKDKNLIIADRIIHFLDIPPSPKIDKQEAADEEISISTESGEQAEKAKD